MTKSLSYVIETAERGFYDDSNKKLITKSMKNFAKMKLQTLQDACSYDLVVGFGYILAKFNIDCRNTYSLTYNELIALLLEYPKSKNKEDFFIQYEHTLSSFSAISSYFRILADSDEYAGTIYNTQIKALYECMKNSSNAYALSSKYKWLVKYAKEKLDYDITDSTTVKTICDYVYGQQLFESPQSTKLSYHGKKLAQLCKYIFGDLFSTAFKEDFNVEKIQSKYPDFDEAADEDFYMLHYNLSSF